MERNWALRQENILPLETAWNEGRFYGRVLKGTQPLSGIQRAGILLLGVQFVGIVAMMIWFDWPFLKVGPTLRSFFPQLPNVPLIWIPLLFLEFVLGLRMCWVAVKRPAK